MAEYTEQELDALLLRAAFLYATNDPEAVQYQEGLTQVADSMDDQDVAGCFWEKLEITFEVVDLVQGMTPGGSLRQREAYFSHREGRPSRYPGALSTDQEFAQRLQELQEEYERRGIPYGK